ncbi:MULTISPECIES: hypothetical protein [Leptospira]|uniref:hypothetical protein n=1 Tax=Leptospira TaxID=171 RepID=UPI0002BF8B53|nr:MULTISPECIES: hypothetical protein [Leptospira]EMK04646.1 hypothetical protein LEP1GSC166_2183 [Leptospira kirschneri]KXZ27196.1 hypothetical protein AYB32_15115 [Leptospira kirschneri]KXZ31976.1 hypothetical protein AYB34_14535 [Leptospira sp. ZV016]
MNFYSKFNKEILVGILSLLVLGGSFFLFWKEGAVDFGKREAVGNITFKYRTAQRKFSDHMIWQDVEQNFPIFNQDSVRTDELSEAIVTLKSGTKFELDPRSMIVIHLKEEEELLKLEEGSVKIQTDHSMSLISGKTVLKSSDEHGIFRITRNENDVVESTKGNLRWTDSEGHVGLIREGESVRVGKDTVIPIQQEWKLLEPVDNNRFFPETGDAKIRFRWKSDSGFVGLLEISLNRNFNSLIFKKEIKGDFTEESFPEGIYYWRLVSSDRKKFSEVRKFRILPNPPVTLLFPLKNTTLEGSALQSFRWKPSQLATGYILEISQSSDFKSELKKITVFKTSISIPLSVGRYHWRVKTFSNLSNMSSVSEVRSFSIEDIKSIISSETISIEAVQKNKDDFNGNEIERIPKLVYPIHGGTVDMTGRNSIVFRWKHNSNSKTEKWNLNLYGKNGEPIFKRSVNGESFRLTDLSILDVGKFRWALIQEGNESNQNKAEFTIVLREDLATPETKTTGKKGE